MKNEKFWYITTLIAMCGMGAASIGLAQNLVGIFYTAIAQDLGIKQGTAAFTSTVLFLCSGTAGMLVVQALKRYPLKPIVCIGIALATGGTYCLSLCHGLGGLFFWNAIRGIGCGMTSFVASTIVINAWFFKNHGVFTSIAMAFSGIPGMLFSKTLVNAIDTGGWQHGYVIAAIIMLCFQLPALLFPIKKTPAEAGLKPYGYDEFMKQPVKQLNSEEGELPKSQFWFVWLFSVSVCVIAAVPSHLPSLAVSLGLSTAVGGAMSSMVQTANMGSKVISGFITDKWGSLKAIYFNMVLNTLAGIMMILHPTAEILTIASFFYGFLFANSGLGVSLVTSDIFGPANYGKYYATMTLTSSIVLAFTNSLLGYLYDVTGSYLSVIWVGLCMQVIAFATVTMAYKNKEVRK